MSVLLLILAILGVVVVVDAVLENTASSSVTLFGQELTGFSHGEWLAVAAALGFAIMLLLAGAVAAGGRRRARRQDLRATKDEMADRVAELERENFALRESQRSAPPPHARPTSAPAASTAPPAAETRTPPTEETRTPPKGTLKERLTGVSDRSEGPAPEQRAEPAEERHDTASGRHERGVRG
jgi:hypothetical protein